MPLNAVAALLGAPLEIALDRCGRPEGQEHLARRHCVERDPRARPVSHEHRLHRGSRIASDQGTQSVGLEDLSAEHLEDAKKSIPFVGEPADYRFLEAG